MNDMANFSPYLLLPQRSLEEYLRQRSRESSSIKQHGADRQTNAAHSGVGLKPSGSGPQG